MKQILIFIAVWNNQNWERPPTSRPLTYLMFPSETFEQEYVKWEPGLRPSPRVDEFFNQLKERRLFHSSKIFLPGVKTLLLWIYTRTAKINGMGDPSRDLLIRREGSLKSSQIPALMAIWPTPTHKQQRLCLLSSPSLLPSAREDNSRRALEALRDGREGQKNQFLSDCLPAEVIRGAAAWRGEGALQWSKFSPKVCCQSPCINMKGGWPRMHINQMHIDV